MAKNEPSPRELDVLKALWALGSGSVREVHRRMCPGGELAFNTVQTLLRIMEEKGLVRHRTLGRTFVYLPSYSRDRVTRRLLHRVFDGASMRSSSASCRRRTPAKRSCARSSA